MQAEEVAHNQTNPSREPSKEPEAEAEVPAEANDINQSLSFLDRSEEVNAEAGRKDTNQLPPYNDIAAEVARAKLQPSSPSPPRFSWFFCCFPLVFL